MAQLKEEDLARVLFAAIALGGPTLTCFKKATQDVSSTRKKNVCVKLEKLLWKYIGFNEIFAKWLSENLHRLTEASVKLLDSLDNESYMYVRMATVSEFAYVKKMETFKSRARVIFKGF